MAIGRWRGPAPAAVTVAVALLGAVTSPPGRTSLDALGVVLLVVAGLSNAARDRAPRTVLGVTVVAALAYEARGYPGLAPMVPFLLALANAAWRGHRRPAMIAVAVMVVGGLVVQETIGSAPGDTRQDVTQRWFLAVGWMVAAIVAGTLAARYQTYLAAVEQRAEEAERTREEVARRRADEERLRIARELHDSLTHSISIIKVQAGVAIHLARKRHEPIPDALIAIEKAGGEAMRELRATLEVLRGDEETGSGLDRLDLLVDGARQAGLPIQLDVTGHPHDLPAPVGRAAYRIIQEALTNVRRHAGPGAAASVRLSYHPTELTVHVDNCSTERATATPSVHIGDGTAIGPAREGRPASEPRAASETGPVRESQPAAGCGPAAENRAAGSSGGTDVGDAVTALPPGSAALATANGTPAAGDAAPANGVTSTNGETSTHGVTSTNGVTTRTSPRRAAAPDNPGAADLVGTARFAEAEAALPSFAGTATPGGGVGLRGMRERVAALGGSLEAGPTDGGGFRVRARLPLGAS